MDLRVHTANDGGEISNMNIGQNSEVHQELPDIHPVLAVYLGTSASLSAIRLYLQAFREPLLAPYRSLVIDTLSYENWVKSMEREGYQKELIEEIVPPSNYFQLKDPFGRDFDFDHPMNKLWSKYLFELTLQQIAKTGIGHGGRGTPACAAAYADYETSGLYKYFRRHVADLRSIKKENLSLRPGIKVWVTTTFWGGTGRGALNIVGAILQSTLPTADANSVVTVVGMPDIIDGDGRSYANAYAGIQELRHFHGYERQITMKDGQKLKPPFDEVIPIFRDSDSGAWAMRPKDFIEMTVALSLAEIRASSQAAMDARYTDLTDPIPFDLDDNPQHIGQAHAIRIKTHNKGTVEYICASWLKLELDQSRQYLDSWMNSRSLLDAEEEDRVYRKAKLIEKELGLHLEGLKIKLEGETSAKRELQRFFESIQGRIPGLGHTAIKNGMKGLPTQVQKRCEKIQASRLKRSSPLLKTLSQEIQQAAKDEWSDNPRLCLATLNKIYEDLAEIGAKAIEDAEGAQRDREAFGNKLATALGYVQDDHKFRIFNRDEITRNAASQAIGLAVRAALARITQEANEIIGNLLRTDEGLPARLMDDIKKMEVEEKNRYTDQGQQLTGYLTDQEHRINQDSALFNRGIIFDDMDTLALRKEADRLSVRHPEIPCIKEFLRGALNIEQAVKALKPYLSNINLERSLAELIENNDSVFEEVVKILKSASSFTPIDNTVEMQQGLKGRRDEVLVIEIPGGRDGVLAERLEKAGAFPGNITHISSAKGDEIRYYYRRKGLPYGAIRPLTHEYHEQHHRYIENPQAVSPYTVAEARDLPPIFAPNINVLSYTGELLVSVRAVIPDRMVTTSSGGITLRYQEPTGHGFLRQATKDFADFDGLQRWVTKQTNVRKQLGEELKVHQHNEPEKYKNALLEAYKLLVDGKEKEYLREALYRLKIDPDALLRIPRRTRDETSKQLA